MASQARQAEAKSLKRKDRFVDYDQGSFGVRMHEDDSLKDFTFVYADFPNVRTQNPRHCAITDAEFHYIKDTVQSADRGGLRITDLRNRVWYAEARAITDSNVTKYVMPSLPRTMQHKRTLPSTCRCLVS